MIMIMCSEHEILIAILTLYKDTCQFNSLFQTSKTKHILMCDQTKRTQKTTFFLRLYVIGLHM